MWLLMRDESLLLQEAPPALLRATTMWTARSSTCSLLYRVKRCTRSRPVRSRHSKRSSTSFSSSGKAGPPDAKPREDGILLEHLQAAAAASQGRRDGFGKKLRALAVPGAALSAVTVVVVWYKSREVREWRQDRIETLPMAYVGWTSRYPNRPLQSVVPIIERCGLMGRTNSVKTDLDHIRAWHISNGYTGGLVLRDLSLPAFYDALHDDEVVVEGDDLSLKQREQEPSGDSRPKADPASAPASASTRSPSYLSMTLKDLLTDPVRLARRECYYVYYEVTGDGQQKQQIFCRGTTILMDVLTCLEAWMTFDAELQCRLHRGFCKQADRILEDVVPLLASPHDRRGTVEVCGHSLGGAVATILAAKLRKRGYRVVRVTTAGSPRFCASESDAERLRQLLPRDYLRVEQEFDFVPFLPPFGSHVGDKLWLLGGGLGARFATKQADAWTDSVWYNFMAWEVLRFGGKSHRVPSYTSLLRTSLSEPSIE